MSDNPTTPAPDESVRGTDTPLAAETPTDGSAAREASPRAPATGEAPPSERWSPATDANVLSADDAPPRERTPRDRPRANGGDAPLRRRLPAAELAPAADAEASEGTEPAPEAVPETFEGERIAKAIARAGIASRRDAEALIAEGRVTLNGRVLDTPAINVTDSDAIAIDGEPLPMRERTRLWVFHKPRGLVTTARDPEGRQTVFDVMPEEMPRVVAIGRLDINTEGLLLLTNDGGLAKVIAHPDTGWLRRYRVRAFGDITQGELDGLRKGVTIDGMEYGPVEASLDRATGDNVWLTLGLREGKNREVKRILEHLGLSVNRLIRLSFGPFQLGDLEAGLTEEIRTKVLKEQLGKSLAEQAGVDFESPVREPIAPFGSPKKDPPAARAQRDDVPRTPASRPARQAAPARVPTGGLGAGPRRSVWRADAEVTPDTARPSKVPRRGADPKAARAAVAAERGRERVGAINAGERRVLVERLSASPAPVEEARPQRRYARDETGAKPQRRREADAAASRGDRPYTPRFNDGAARSAPRADRDTGVRSEGDERPRAARGERRDGARTEGARPEGRGYQGKRPAGKPSGFGAKSSGGFGASGGERPSGYKGRVAGSYAPRGDDGVKGRPSGSRPAGAKPGGFGAGKPGGFGGNKAGGFGGKPGGFGAKPGGRPGGGRPPSRGGR